MMWLAAWEVAVLLHSELELAQLASDNLMAVSELPDGIPSGGNHHGSSGSPEGRNCGTGSLHYGNMDAGIHHEVVSLSHSHTHSC